MMSESDTNYMFAFLSTKTINKIGTGSLSSNTLTADTNGKFIAKNNRNWSVDIIVIGTNVSIEEIK